MTRRQRLVSAASASSLVQSTAPRRFAPGSNARRYARIRIGLCPDVCRAIPPPRGGTTRTQSHGCRTCRAPRRMPPQAWLEREACPARPRPITTSLPAADWLRPHSRYHPARFHTGCRDCIVRRRRPLGRPGAAVSPTRRPWCWDVPPPRMTASKAVSSRSSEGEKGHRRLHHRREERWPFHRRTGPEAWVEAGGLEAAAVHAAAWHRRGIPLRPVGDHRLGRDQ